MTNNDDWSERPTSIAPNGNPEQGGQPHTDQAGAQTSAGSAWAQSTNGQPNHGAGSTSPQGAQPYPNQPQAGQPASGSAPYGAAPQQGGQGYPAGQPQQQPGQPAYGQQYPQAAYGQQPQQPNGQQAPQQQTYGSAGQGTGGQGYASQPQAGAPGQPYAAGGPRQYNQQQVAPQSQRGPFAQNEAGAPKKTATTPGVLGLGAKVAWGALAGGVLALIGVFGAWVTLSYSFGSSLGSKSASLNGLGMGGNTNDTDTPWRAHGYIILVLALVAIVIAVLRALGKVPKVASWAAAGAGLITLGLAIYDWSDIHDELVKANDSVGSLGNGASFSGSVGWGLFLALFAGLVMLVTGALSALRD